MDIYYKNIFYLITSISLICKKNYTTDINNTHAMTLPKKKQTNKRLTKVERSKININSNEALNEIIIGRLRLLGDGHIQSRQLNGNCRFMYGQSSP